MGCSTNNQKKQEQEKAVFEMFTRDFELPEGQVVYADRPDVVIDGPRKIAIEITDLYLADGDNPDSEQVQQRHRDAVLRKRSINHAYPTRG
jgi:predicted PhzF superfamily epimerase YddE/YHI9